LFTSGVQIAAVENPAIDITDSVALPYQMLATTIHGPQHVLPEAAATVINP
jgi:hypothetical protein